MYYIVPFENETHIVHGTESRALTEEEVETIFEAVLRGEDVQEVLANVW